MHQNTFGISTDHLPITIRIPCEVKEEKQELRTVRPYKKMDMETFKKDLELVLNNIVNSEDNFENTYNKYKEEASELLNHHCPEEVKKVRKENNPKWMDAEYKKARAERRKLERSWRKSKSEEDHQQYVLQRNLCSNLSIKKQEGHYSKLIDSADNKQKSLFKVVDKLLDKKDERILPVHTDPVDLANKFNKYYVEKIDKLRESIPDSTGYHQKRTKFSGEKLSEFAPTTVEEVKEIIKERGIKTSSEDPLPVEILREITEEMYPALVKLVNLSLSEGSVEGIKRSELDPLLKKLGLDSEVYKNYRPVNNLVFLSKLIERIVNKRIDAQMAVNNLHNKKAFGYKTGHSTETMMLGVVNDVLTGFDEDKCTVMLFLDLSAAFDTIDVDKLLNILNEEIGLEGKALAWCKSFLTNRTQRVKIEGQYSEELEVKYGSVQGSVLGPKFFNIYVRSQPQVFGDNGFETSSFADDSNGSKTFSIKFQYDVLKNDVAKCIEEVVKWSNHMFLKINPDKTEIILFYPKALEDQVLIKGTFVGDDCIRYSREVKNVGVWLDSNLKMDKHINSVVSHCYKLLKNIGRIRRVLSTKQTETLVHSVITSKLDYCNSLLINISKSNLFKLQKVQNAAARLVVRGRKRDSVSDVLRKLHWLRIDSRIIFKILLLVYKRITGQCSQNLNIKFKSHNCRPQDYLLLETKSVKTKYGKRTFDYAAPRLWNALPLHMRMEEDIDSFKKQLKTLLFDGTEELKRRATMYN